MLSPLVARTNVPASSAAIPDPVATASTAFSREAMRFSSIRTVGLSNRE